MTTKIFVGSLPSGCKPEELRRLFEGFGVVTECDVMNRCGFVHMETANMAETAIKALNSTEFKGETINVEPGRIRGERNQKVANAGGKAGAPRPVRINNRGRMNRGGGMGPQDMKFDDIDENTRKEAIVMVSAVFDEMNKMLNPMSVNQGRNRRGGGGGGNNNNAMALPKNFASQLEMLGGMGAPMGNMPNNRNRNRNNRNNSAGGGPIHGNVGRAPNQGNAAAPQGNVGRQQNQGNSGRQQNAGNAGRAQNQAIANKEHVQGKTKIVAVQDNVAPKANAPRSYPDRKNQGKSAERPQNQGNAGRAPQNQHQGNAVRGPKQGNVGPIRNDPVRQRNIAAPYNRGNNSGGNMNFSDDMPVAQSTRNFANNLAGGNQNERWTSNSGNFGNNNGGLNQLMNRNFDEDMPVTNFNNDLPINTGLGLGNLNSLSNFNSNRNNSIGNQGGFSNLGNNAGGNDRFQSGGGSSNDRFQSGSNFGMGNQDRRGFALPERQIFNDNQKFGNNQDFRSGNTQSAGLGNQGSMGGGNRDFGFGSNSNRQLESRNMGGSGGSGGMGGSDSAMFTRRNYNSDGNNMGSNRMRSDNNDNTFGGNFGGNNQRGSNSGGLGGNPNSNNAGYNRNNMGASNNNRNMGGSGGLGMSNMGGGNNGNRNMGGSGGGNNNSRNNMGGNQMGSLNFQKEFPPLSSGQNMNNRNGPRQNQSNMMSNRRW